MNLAWPTAHAAILPDIVKIGGPAGARHIHFSGQQRGMGSRRRCSAPWVRCVLLLAHQVQRQLDQAREAGHHAQRGRRRLDGRVLQHHKVCALLHLCRATLGLVMHACIHGYPAARGGAHVIGAPAPRSRRPAPPMRGHSRLLMQHCASTRTQPSGVMQMRWVHDQQLHLVHQQVQTCSLGAAAATLPGP